MLCLFFSIYFKTDSSSNLIHIDCENWREQNKSKKSIAEQCLMPWLKFAPFLLTKQNTT